MKSSEKREYLSPWIKSLEIRPEELMALSNVVSQDENGDDTGIGYGGGGSGPAYSRWHWVWDDDDE